MNFDTTQLLAVAAAMGWASGLRLYAVLFLTGLAGMLGWVELPRGLVLLQNPWMLGTSGLMFAAEFFADKIPVVDTIWDAVHTFVRIPAGAALAASVFGADQATWAGMAALLGGSLAATSHVAKATTRAAVNTSPEPFSNIGMSLLGDAAVPAVLALAYAYPLTALTLLGLVTVVMLVAIVVLFRFLRARLRRWRRRGRSPQPADVVPPEALR